MGTIYHNGELIAPFNEDEEFFADPDIEKVVYIDYQPIPELSAGGRFIQLHDDSGTLVTYDAADIDLLIDRLQQIKSEARL